MLPFVVLYNNKPILSTYSKIRVRDLTVNINWLMIHSGRSLVSCRYAPVLCFRKSCKMKNRSHKHGQLLCVSAELVNVEGIIEADLMQWKKVIYMHEGKVAVVPRGEGRIEMNRNQMIYRLSSAKVKILVNFLAISRKCTIIDSSLGFSQE